jgi:hypothetical protein
MPLKASASFAGLAIVLPSWPTVMLPVSLYRTEGVTYIDYRTSVRLSPAAIDAGIVGSIQGTWPGPSAPDPALGFIKVGGSRIVPQLGAVSLRRAAQSYAGSWRLELSEAKFLDLQHLANRTAEPMAVAATVGHKPSDRVLPDYAIIGWPSTDAQFYCHRIFIEIPSPTLQRSGPNRAAPDYKT